MRVGTTLPSADVPCGGGRGGDAAQTAAVRRGTEGTGATAFDARAPPTGRTAATPSAGGAEQLLR